MAWSSWDANYKKNEKSPLDRFKHRSSLVKTFGDDGPRVYDALNGSASAQEVCQKLGIGKKQFATIMDYIVSHGYAHILGEKKGEPAPPEDEELPEAEDEELHEDEGIKQAARPDAYVPEADDDELSDTDSPNSLSPLERIIWDKYGEIGVRIYNLIDGERTAEEILKQTGASESKLVEILEFMNEQGIIKLEKPPAAKKSPMPPPRMYGTKEKAADGSKQDAGFKPMVEVNTGLDKTTPTRELMHPSYIPEESESGEKEPPNVIQVDVPIMKKLSFVEKARLAAITLKFGKAGRDLIKLVDGVRDFVDIAIESRQPLSNLDIVFGELGKAGIMSFKPLTRGELQRRYGDDGFAVYKRFGRDGVLIYQLIGRETSIRDIIEVSNIEPKRAAKIIMFIHRMLGLDIPLDQDMLYRYVAKKT